VENYFERTGSTLKNIVMTGTSSGFSEESSMSFEDIDYEKISEESMESAVRGMNPSTIEPGKYEVILSPYAVEEFLSSMKYLSLSAKMLKKVQVLWQATLVRDSFLKSLLFTMMD